MTKIKANWLCNALGGDRQKAPDTPKGGEFRNGSWVKDLLGDCNDIFEQGTRRKSRCAGNLCIVNSPGWLCPNIYMVQAAIEFNLLRQHVQGAII